MNLQLSELSHKKASSSSYNDREVKPKVRQYAFKGFKEGLICNLGWNKKFEYKVGETYTHEGRIGLCSSGFHYCYRMSDVFNHYSNNPKHVFAIVEPSGEILTSSDKSCSSKIKVVKILTPEEIKQFIDLEEDEKYERDIFCLDIIQQLQEKYNFAIGGSCALFLQGITLDRKKGSVDFDIIMPYYQKFDLADFTDENIEGIEEFDGKGSGNDYAHTFAITTKDGRFIKLDIKIKPEQKYTTVDFKGFKYKVCDILTILEAKVRYAMQGNDKHKQDVLSMIQYDTTPITKTKSTEDLFQEILKEVINVETPAPIITSVKNGDKDDDDDWVL